MEFKKISLIGAGAVGAYFIYGFTGLEGIEFNVLAEGERAERLKRGININGKLYFPEIREASHDEPDLLLICTKYEGLKEAALMAEKAVKKDTTVMCLLNGIDSEEIVGDRIGHGHMLYSVMRISSERSSSGISFNPETTIGVSVGEKGDKKISEREEAFIKLMNRAKLRVIPEEDIVYDQWSKYLMNIIHNLPQAVLGVGFGTFYSSENMAYIRNRMFEEVVRVAEAEGIMGLKMGDWRKACRNEARFSTLQDLDNGRRTEVDMFAGTLMRLARKHGIEVPFTEFCYHAIKVLEER